MNSWTETRVEMLREMWGEKLPASQIALRLGGVSRNAVIGKAHRMGLEGRPSPIKFGTGNFRRNRGARKQPMTTLATYLESPPAVDAAIPPSVPAVTAPPVRQSAATVPLPVSSRLPGEQEGGGRPCQWPMWDDKVTHEFCGAHAMPGRSYCPHHMAVAYYKPATLGNATSDPGRLERLAAAE